MYGYVFNNLIDLNTNNPDAIDSVIMDGNDIPYAPILGTYNGEETDNEKLWPYVEKMRTLSANGVEQTTFGAESITFELTFNRDMNMNVPIRVSFGSYGKSADYEVDGEFINTRTWVGHFTVTRFIESGVQGMNVSGGQAADDSFMDVQECDGRLRFNIDTTNALSQSIYADARDDGIMLSWAQDDYDLETVMGYNLYRSDEKDGNYTKLNNRVIPKDETEFMDVTVLPGETYWYTFTIILTDFTETKPAGKITVAAKDTMDPNIYHSPVKETYTENELTISCVISDNIGITKATLYYRTVGETTFKSKTMRSVSDKYSATISSNEITLAGIEYYIAASDGTNTVYQGTVENPYVVIVKEISVIENLGDVDNDGEITVKDAYMILNHIYGEIILTQDQFLRADLNGDGVLTTPEALRILQYINGTIDSLQW